MGRWTTFDHKNVAKYYGYTKQPPLPALVIKYYAKGNIIRYLNNESLPFDDRLLLVTIMIPCACNSMLTVALWIGSGYRARARISTFTGTAYSTRRPTRRMCITCSLGSCAYMELRDR